MIYLHQHNLINLKTSISLERASGDWQSSPNSLLDLSVKSNVLGMSQHRFYCPNIYNKTPLEGVRYMDVKNKLTLLFFLCKSLPLRCKQNSSCVGFPKTFHCPNTTHWHGYYTNTVDPKRKQISTSVDFQINSFQSTADVNEASGMRNLLREASATEVYLSLH